MTGHTKGVGVNEVYAILRLRVKAEAEKKQLTISDLAERSTLSKTRVREILEDSMRQITLRELAALAMALEIPAQELLSSSD